jgi:sigma54-dependent transcription regulator
MHIVAAAAGEAMAGGDPTPRPTDVRLITMTNRNLQDEIAAGRFRTDLYYRIAVTKVTLQSDAARPFAGPPNDAQICWSDIRFCTEPRCSKAW